MAPSIRVTMLGKFTIAEGGNAPVREISLTGRSRRLWTLTAYLIIHRDRGVSAQELIDLLWPEAENDNPTATLQNNVSRARAALGELGLSDPKGLIRYEGGLYSWAPDGMTWVDYDSFEMLGKQALACGSDEDFLPMAQKAIELYGGDFLPEAALELWCINLNTFYRSLYLRLCRRAVNCLMALGRTAEAEQICTAAIRVDPTVEEFSVLLMRCLIQAGNPRKALEQYDYIRQLYRDTYGVVPSAELELAKTAAISQLYGQEMGEKELAALLREQTQEPGAFFCDNAVFRELVNLRAREMKRNRIPVQVALVQLKAPSVSPEKQAVHMKQMEGVLLSDLRGGDPFTRVGTTRFAVLLTGVTPDIARAVMERVMNRFRKEHPRMPGEFSFLVTELERIFPPEE